MAAFTPPLKTYIEEKLGGIDVESKEFWDIYLNGLQELFETMHQVDGIMIRIGEAGPLYNRKGWEYTSELIVRTTGSVKNMLRTFIAVAEDYDKYIIFRSWSVGVGEVGRMHTDTDVYDRILGDIYSDNLLVSTKLTKGDFWNNVPTNPTLYRGRHNRLVELQARREFEAFNVIPNYVAPVYQSALAGFMEKNPNIEGVWVWTQAGGPLRQGPLMIYPFHGMWLWTDANIYATAKIAQNPGEPVETWTRQWVRSTFGGDKETEDKLTGLLLGSHATAVRGLTIPKFARKEVSGVGMEIPPVIYSYWDIVGASTSVMSLVYSAAESEVDEAVAEGFLAVDEVKRMREVLASVEDSIDRGKEWIPGMKASLEYEQNLFETLAYHKMFLLKFYQWLDEGGKETELAWKSSIADYKRVKAIHMERYGGNLDLPAYNFDIADNGVRQAELSGAAVITARALLVVLIVFFFWIILKGTKIEAGAWMPIFLSVFTFGMLEAFTSFGAPLFVLTTGIPALFYFTGLRFIIFRAPGRRGFAISLLPVLIFMGVLLSVISWRGPYLFWFSVWTSATFRMVLAVTTAVLLIAHFYIVFSIGSRIVSKLILTGRILFVTGSIVFLYSLIYLIFGMDRTLGHLNDEVLVMPVMVSRVLGFSTHLDFLVDINIFLVWAGAIMTITGLIISDLGPVWRNGRRQETKLAKGRKSAAV